MTERRGQAWIHSAWADSLLVLLPAFGAVALVWGLSAMGGGERAVSPWWWLILIVGVDVSHVYSTLYRTYFDKEEFKKYRQPLLWIPVMAWGIGIALYAIDGMVFWRILAYLAVYHFMRQQYGFFSIYARQEQRSTWERWVDAAAIYLATFYPIIYWHCHLPRNYNWFMEGDFFQLPWPWLADLVLGFYLLALLTYLAKEIWRSRQNRFFNWPKNLILLGTVLSWYLGIVWLNGDLAFTATNVLAHGIPYMALIWFYGKKKHGKALGESQSGWFGKLFRLSAVPVFLGILLAIAYFEEGIWDALIWRDHEGLFPWAKGLPFLSDGLALAVVVPLLAMPQVTHYLIDGFIWRVRKPRSEAEKKIFGGI